MDWHFRPLAIPLVLGALGMAWVMLLALRTRAPGRVVLILLSLAFAVYDLGYAFEIGSSRVEQVRLSLKLQYLGVALLPVYVLLLAFGYTGGQRRPRPVPLALLGLVPAATCALAFTNERHELIWRGLRIDPGGAFTRTFFERGYWYWVHNGYGYLLLGGALALIAGELPRARGLHRRQLLVLLLAVLIPVLTHAVYLLATPVFGGLDPNPYAQSLTGLVLAWGMLDARLWDVLPIAREAVLSGVSDPVVVVDQLGRLADLNPAAQDLLAGGTGLPLGRPAAEAFPALAAGFARAASGEASRAELALVVRGQMRHFEAKFTPLPLTPGVTGAVVLLHDITQREEAQRLKQALTRTMVHDLRNPLTAIQGALELLAAEDERLGPQLRDLVEIGRQGAGRMVDVVDGILDIERLRSGRLELERRPLDLAATVREAVRLQSSLAGVKGQRVELELHEALSPVEADAALLSRVLQNLIGNAVKFAPRAGRIQIAARPLADRRSVEVVVSDDGPGVPTELLPRLFNEFVAGDSALSGSGLGLAFCRLVIEAHGGEIDVLSEPGRGAAFRFRLPVSAGSSVSA